MIDFLIIGGGIAGLSAAANLSKHGSVRLLEAEEALGYHASGRSAALYEPNYGNAPVKALSRASGPDFIDGGYLSARGFLLLGTADDRELYEQDLQNLTCEEISVQEALGKVPILDEAKLIRAAYHEGAQDIDTDRLLQDYAKALRKQGGEVSTRSKVTAITRTAHGWDVTAGEERLRCKALVNATGPWADEIAKMAGLAPLGLQPYRRSMARIAAPGGHECANWPIFFGAGEAWYAKPDAGQLIVSPAEEDPIAPMDAWPEDMVLAEGLARYQEMVTEPVTRPTASWAGLRTFAPDRALVLGPDPAEPSFIWSAGQGGYGFQTGPAAGRLVAALASGECPELDPKIVAKLSPARFA